MSAAWRELFVHAVREADGLGLRIDWNLSSGWVMGGRGCGPRGPADDWYSRKLWSRGRRVSRQVATARRQHGIQLDPDWLFPPVSSAKADYRDVAVAAFRTSNPSPDRTSTPTTRLRAKSTATPAIPCGRPSARSRRAAGPCRPTANRPSGSGTFWT